MSWRNSVILVLLPLMLAGCGFHPLYSKDSRSSDQSKLLAGVKIDPITGRPGQIFKSNLEDLLNPGGALPTNPTYRLHVTFKSSITPIGVARDGTVSRYNVYLSSDYVLYRNSDDKPITSGSLGYIDSYNNLTNAYFSTYISEEDAYKRGITELSELYRQRLAVYLDSGAPVQKEIHIPKEGDSTSMPNGQPTFFNPRPY